MITQSKEPSLTFLPFIHVLPFIHSLEALENAASFAAAYQIGRLESGAAVNLLTGVTDRTRSELKDLVRLGHSSNFKSCFTIHSQELLFFFKCQSQGKTNMDVLNHLVQALWPAKVSAARWLVCGNHEQGLQWCFRRFRTMGQISGQLPGCG